MSQNELERTESNGKEASADQQPPAAAIPAWLAALPNPEVPPKAERRRFTAAYKLRILQAAAACTARGELGALLRREGLYASHLHQWRQEQAAGALQGLAPKPRGRRTDPQAEEIARLRRENERLQQQLQRAETIIEVQKKLSQLLGLPVEPARDEPK